MTKPIVRESRFDFRGGRNTAVSADLLDASELVDATNTRLVGSYGAFTKRTGTQRIHPDAFAMPIRGVTQWDIAGSKQTVVISNGFLYWRNGTSYTPSFTQASTTAVARTTAALALPAAGSRGWTDPDGVDDGGNSATATINAGTTTVAAGSRLTNRIGVAAYDDFPDAADDRYSFSFKVFINGAGLSGTYAAATADVQVEYATNGGAFTLLPDVYRASCGIGGFQSLRYDVTVIVPGAPARVDFRLRLSVYAVGLGSGTCIGGVQCFNTVYKTDNFPVTWSTGAALFSLTEPAVFAPFRASTAGAPLVLYIASGGHYFSWDGTSTLTQLDPTNAAPTATAIISYHTRMFSMMASTAVPGLLPKTIAWSKIGDATQFTVSGLKSDGGAAVTDFLTGQQLTALEVIGSSLLMATPDSVMRFTGQSSDDIVIAQNTEGVSAEVGAVGIQALRRFENAAGMLAARGPYAVTETAAMPIGEKVLPDFDALDSTNLSKSIVVYNKGRKELLFIVPSATDGGVNKTIYVYSTRLQSWYGPWLYSFGMLCASTYVGASGIESVVVGCSDGYVRLLDAGFKDDLLYDGSGGSNITMTVELPLVHFRALRVATLPGMTVALNRMALQATLPTGSALQLKTSFDGDAFTIDSIASAGTAERNYRVDLDGQGKRLRVQFVDASAVAPIVNGFVLEAYQYGRP